MYAVVDGVSSSGAYTLNVGLTAARCGDGALNPDEECDFGEQSSWPGCDPLSCFFLQPGDDDVCGVGNPINVTSGAATVDGHTVGYSDSYTPECTAAGAGSPDRVVTFIAFADGMLRVRAEADFDVALHAFLDCDSGALSEVVACSDDGRRDAQEELAFPMRSGQAYHVVVDGFDGSSGSFTLTAELTPEPEQ